MYSLLTKFPVSKTKCANLRSCQKYVNTYACGWDSPRGVMYKRVGRAKGKCTPKSQLRMVRSSWFDSTKKEMCPNDWYHLNSYEERLNQNGGLRFCDCDGC